jgi:hypothetical protein
MVAAPEGVELRATEYDEEFETHMLPKLDIAALKQAASDVRC